MSSEDIAQQVELREWELNNLNRREAMARHEPDSPGYGPAECDECGDDMPAERRAWGLRICVACKSEQESLGKRRRSP